MFIERLFVKDVRNLESVDVTNFTSINFFLGANGSGKTALLEALSLVSLGRSFRTRNINTVIRKDQSLASVFAHCSTEAGDKLELGIARDREKNISVSVNGEKSRQLASLSYSLPSLFFDTAEHELIDGPPSKRLAFIDWGVFHVEHAFLSLWRTHKRLIQQRNQLLKSSKHYESLLDLDKKLVTIAYEIESIRYRYLCHWLEAFRSIVEQYHFDLGEKVVFIYQDGFKQINQEITPEISASLADIINEELYCKQVLALLESQYSLDLKKKYSRYHTGKSVLSFKVETSRAEDFYSRGEQKIFSYFLKISQAFHLKMSQSIHPIFLIDDISAELDNYHFQLLIHVLSDLGFQCFITSSDLDIQNTEQLKTKDISMFHVKHGKIYQ